MRLTFKQLKSRAVETVSGRPLGRIADCVIQWDDHMIVHYAVKSSLLGGSKLLIAPSQIVRLEERKLIVHDSVEGNAPGSPERKPIGISPEPVAMQKDG